MLSSKEENNFLVQALRSTPQINDTMERISDKALHIDPSKVSEPYRDLLHNRNSKPNWRIVRSLNTTLRTLKETGNFLKFLFLLSKEVYIKNKLIEG